jgi:hypothetical protein
MSLTAADIIALVTAGSTVAIAADGGITITPPDGKRKASNAERCRRYRMSKHVETMSDHVESMSRHANDMAPSPSPPPLSPLHPPLPAPTPTPTPTARVRIREGRGGKAGNIEADITAADEEPLPLELMLPAFRDVWADWCLHRAELYRAYPVKRWTARAARNTLTECARHGAELSAMAITAAISNGWQGLVWDRLQYAPNHSPNGHNRTTNRPALTRNAEPLLAGQPSLNTSGNCGGGHAGTVSGVPASQRPSLDENGEECW